MEQVVRHNLNLIKECLIEGDYEGAVKFAKALDDYLNEEENSTENV